MKKRLVGILLSFALMLTMMPVLGMSLTAYAKTSDATFEAIPVTEYQLWVGETQVTSANASDVLANDPTNKGKVSFTPAKDGDPAKLTLNGANITKGYDYEPGTVYGIYYKGDEHEPLIIESPSGSDNKIIRSGGKFDTGIRSINDAAITLSGNGKLTTEGSSLGIYACDIIIDGTDVTATSDRTAIDGEVVIKSGSKLTAAGDGYGILGTVKNHIDGTGWSDKAGTKDKKAIAINTEGQELTAYKKVQFPAEVEKVTVKFDSAGGSAVAAQTIEKGAKATKPADPTRSGYTFDGWYLGSTAFDFNTAVNENITLTARWKENAKPTPTTDPGDQTPATGDSVAVGSVHKVGAGTYVVKSANTVWLKKAAKNKKSFTVPAAVKIKGKAFKVTGINAKVFKGTKVKTLTVKTKKLTKKSVKGSLKGSKVKKIRVKVGKKKENKKYVKKYKKIFTKKNCGKKVTVK